MRLRDDPNARSYLNDRMIIDKGSYSVIWPVDCEIIDIFCPVCEFAVRTKDDEHAMRTLQCCELCARRWAYPNLERWKSGWRPSDDEGRSCEPRELVMPKLAIE